MFGGAGVVVGSGERDWGRRFQEHSGMYSLQGRRETQEDRCVVEEVPAILGLPPAPPVTLWAVMDGHGGAFCAEFASQHLLAQLSPTVQKLKLLTSKLQPHHKLQLYEKHFSQAPKCVLKYLQISETEHEKLKENTAANVKDSENVEVVAAEQELDKKDENHKKRNKFVSTPHRQSKSSKKKNNGTENEVPITDFIKDSKILYPALLKDEINKFDTWLLEAARKSNSIGGTTLVLALHDSGNIWLANVGDSRAVFMSRAGLAVPMSYDHKATTNITSN